MREPLVAVGASTELEHEDFDVRSVNTWADALRLLRRHGRGLLLAKGDVPDAVRQQVSLEMPAVEFIDSDCDDLSRELGRASKRRDRRLARLHFREQVNKEGGFATMLGTSPIMADLFELLENAAGTRATVLITGESGTGKELVARALHERGTRREQPFVALNCSAVPANLLESELFGHVRGAFTDARQTRSGLFVKATGGTLFLDEIGELPLDLQPKLLRALQERVVRPVGSDQETPFDVRVIAATNRDLEAAVAAGSFREDLFYRLNVIHVDVPPLRERATDILLLAESFSRRAAADLGKEIEGLSRAASQRLLAYGWPGNVRELQNFIERAVALCNDDVVGVEDLPVKLRQEPLVVEGQAMPFGEDELVTLAVLERRYIERVLDAVGGNRKAAARVLGVDRKTLYRKLLKYRLGELTDCAAPNEDA